jgi:hypothetical protein
MATESIKPGSYVAFSEGCYSDYGVNGFAKCLKEINPEVWQEMVDACTGPQEWDPSYIRFESGKAVPWLIANGYIEEIQYAELHMDDYGEQPSWSHA